LIRKEFADHIKKYYWKPIFGVAPTVSSLSAEHPSQCSSNTLRIRPRSSKGPLTSLREDHGVGLHHQPSLRRL
jgi:hypothetical protein